MKLRRRAPKSQGGFTLLEVMIAMTIMSLALAAIYTSQSDGIYRTIRSREFSIAAWLAQNKMVETEHLYEAKEFSELPKSAESEKFKEPFDRFTWSREVKEVKFPELPLAPAKEGDPLQEVVRIMAKTVTKYISTALRELIVTVSWDRGKGEQKVTITTYLVDLNAEFTLTP